MALTVLGTSRRQCKGWISLSAILWIVLNLDGTLARCYGKVDLKAEVAPKKLTSPDYPNNYPPGSDCVWDITSDHQFVQLNFEDIDLEKAASCPDYVTIHDGSKTKVLCGPPTDKIYTSSSYRVKITFNSDGTNAKRGFKIAYTATGNVRPPACAPFKDKVIPLQATSTKQFLTSPDYPNNYPHDCVAKWLITSDSGLVKFTLMEVDFETRSGCRYDNVTFYDGQTNGNRLFSICTLQTWVDKTFATSSKYLEVVFASDSSTNRKGFKIAYQAEDACGCNGPATDLQANENPQTLTSPGYRNQYPYNCRCEWIIHSDNKIVQFQVDDIDLGPIGPSNSCSYDYLEVYDGPSSDNTSRRLCSPNAAQYNRTFHTTSQNSLVRFKSDYTATGRGFKISYQTRDIPLYSICSGEVINLQATSSSKSISLSANQQGQTPCRWLITSDEDYVKFSLSISFDEACREDFIEIHDGRTTLEPVLLRKSCSSIFEVETLESTSKFVYVHVESYGSISAFQIRYRDNSNGADEDHEDGLSLWAICGICVGLIVLGIAIGFLVRVFCLQGKKVKPQGHHAAGPEKYVTSQPPASVIYMADGYNDSMGYSASGYTDAVGPPGYISGKRV